MNEFYICEECGQETNNNEDGCPYCGADEDKLIDSIYGHDHNDWYKGEFEDFNN